jgi:hypothetical protein
MDQTTPSPTFISRFRIAIIATVCLLVAFLLLALLALEGVAFAQVTTTTTTPAAATTGGLAIQELLVPISGALVAALIAVLGFVAMWLKNKSAQENTSAAGKIAEATGAKALAVMITVVRGLYASMREPMENSAKDGELTSEEKKQLRDAAVAAFQSSISDALKQAMIKDLGVSEAGVATYAAGITEVAVDRVKIERADHDRTHAVLGQMVAEAGAKQAASEALISDVKPCPSPTEPSKH